MMKRTLMIILAVAAMATGCYRSDKGESKLPPAPDYTAPIALSADITANDKTRAAVEGDAFPANATNVFRLTAFSGSTAPAADWSATPYFNDIQVNSVNSVLTLTPSQYYPVDGAKIYFYAWAPAGATLTAGTASDAPVASYTITGQEDILAAQNTGGIAKVSSGSQTQPTLNFSHKLKQVKFKLVADTSFETGITVTNITVKNVKTSAKLNIGTGALTFEGNADGTLSLPITAGTKDEITTAGTEMNGCLMFEPGTTFKVSVTAGGVTYNDVTVTLSGTNAGAAGVSHIVTLTFKRSGVVPSADIVDWTAGDDANVDIM